MADLTRGKPSTLNHSRVADDTTAFWSISNVNLQKISPAWIESHENYSPKLRSTEILALLKVNSVTVANDVQFGGG
jgi:hypothetical protein